MIAGNPVLTEPAQEERACARCLILEHGRAATCYQLLNPGMSYWFSSGRDAVVGYVSRAGVRVVAGSPVASAKHFEDVVHAFEEDAARNGESVCYFCAEERLASLFKSREGHEVLIVGGQPVWDPAGLNDIIHSRRSLRAQLNRARNKGVHVEQWSANKASGHPELETLLDQWLASKVLPPMHFLAEPRTLSMLRDRQVFVARREGEIPGFLVAAPIPARNGWLVEQIIRHPSAPNGTSELLIDAAARIAADRGSIYFTFGLAPLAARFMDRQSIRPRWLGLLFRWARTYGNGLYNFAGLEFFKAKFQPHRWEPVYAITNEDRFSVRTVYAIASAFSDGAPIGWLARAAARRLTRRFVGA